MVADGPRHLIQTELMLSSLRRRLQAPVNAGLGGTRLPVARLQRTRPPQVEWRPAEWLLAAHLVAWHQVELHLVVLHRADWHREASHLLVLLQLVQRPWQWQHRHLVSSCIYCYCNSLCMYAFSFLILCYVEVLKWSICCYFPLQFMVTYLI